MKHGEKPASRLADRPASGEMAKYRRDMDDLAEFRAKAAQCAHANRSPIMCKDCGTLTAFLPPVSREVAKAAKETTP